MEVTNENFFKEFPTILKHIANASFVAINVEMSGCDRVIFNDAAKSSLQHYYDLIKEDADKYHMLQLGLTLIEEDTSTEGAHFYVLRTYQFCVSPNLDQAEDMNKYLPKRMNDRRTYPHLRDAGLDFEKSITSGVRYLAHGEETEAGELYKAYPNHDILPSWGVYQLETPDREWVDNSRWLIIAWLLDPQPQNAFVKITRYNGQMSSRDRYLIRDLVKKEFPGYRCVARERGTYMKVRMSNKNIIQAQADEEARKPQHAGIVCQIGLRWVFHALTNLSLHGIPPQLLYDFDNMTDDEQRTKTEEFEALKKKLETKKIILVGHDIFHHLAFLLRTFTGSLPRGVEDFKLRVHTMFPTILDTRFMATRGFRVLSLEMRMTLSALHEKFRSDGYPFIAMGREHMRYADLEKSSEAGYNSWLTALLFIKQSMKSMKPDKEPNRPFFTAPENEPRAEAPQRLLPLADPFWHTYVNVLRVAPCHTLECRLVQQ